MKPNRVNTVVAGDLFTLFRDQDSSYRVAPLEAIVSYLDANVSGTDGRSILNGTVDPAVGDGLAGDFFINTTAWVIFGPKTTVWGTGTSLVGPAGSTGPTGIGVPAGGAISTVLTKASGSDYDTWWAPYLSGIDYINMDTTAGATPIEGRLAWDDANGTLAIGLKGGNVKLQVGQELNQLVKHADSTGLADGKVVYAVGSTGDNLTVRYAKGDSAITADTTIGVMTESATGGNKGFMTTYGLVHDIDTSGLTEGAVVWVSPSVAGGMTTTRPVAPNHAVMVGICIRTHAVNGHLFVMPNNGNELSNLHDVLISGPANNDVLTYETASGLWKNKPSSGGGGGIPEAPVDGKSYGRLNSAWAQVLPSSNPDYTGVLSTGTLTYSAPDAVQKLQKSVNSYAQLVFQNSNSGAVASADIVVNNDQSTDSDKYGDFGINSSGFVGTGPLNAPGNVYLTSKGVDLVVGPTSANQLQLLTGGAATAAMTVDTSNVARVPTPASSDNSTAIATTAFVQGTKPRTSTGSVTFANEDTSQQLDVVDVAITAKSQITAYYTSEDYAIQGVDCRLLSKTPGSGYSILVVAPDGATGQIDLTIVIQEAA